MLLSNRSSVFRRLLFLALLFAAPFLSFGTAQAQDAKERVPVGLYKSPPFVMVDESGAATGMAVDLWKRIADDLNLEFDYTIFNSPKALVDAAASGEVGVAVTNLSITKKRAERVNFTQPWFDAGLRIMTSDASSSSGAVIEGLYSAGYLQTYGWMVLAVLIATLGITLFDRRFDPNYPKSWREGLAEGFYTVMLVATSGKPPPRSKLFGWIGKVWAGLWLVCGIGVLAYVTSTVTSVMTTIAITSTINNVDDLPGKTIGVFEGSVADEFAEEIGLDRRVFPGIDEAVAALQNGRVLAVVADAPVLEYYAHTHPNQGLGVVGPIFKPDKYGFALPLDNALTKSITVTLLRLKEEGVVEDLRVQYFGK